MRLGPRPGQPASPPAHRASASLNPAESVRPACAPFPAWSAGPVPPEEGCSFPPLRCACGRLLTAGTQLCSRGLARVQRLSAESGAAVKPHAPPGRPSPRNPGSLPPPRYPCSLPFPESYGVQTLQMGFFLSARCGEGSSSASCGLTAVPF